MSSDWYGTSRLFASRLNSANMDAGNLSEIVLVDGLRFGNALMRYRRLRADYEIEPASSRSWILIAAIHRMARRLAR